MKRLKKNEINIKGTTYTLYEVCKKTGIPLLVLLTRYQKGYRSEYIIYPYMDQINIEQEQGIWLSEYALFDNKEELFLYIRGVYTLNNLGLKQRNKKNQAVYLFHNHYLTLMEISVLVQIPKSKLQEELKKQSYPLFIQWIEKNSKIEQKYLKYYQKKKGKQTQQDKKVSITANPTKKVSKRKSKIITKDKNILDYTKKYDSSGKIYTNCQNKKVSLQSLSKQYNLKYPLVYERFMHGVRGKDLIAPVELTNTIYYGGEILNTNTLLTLNNMTKEEYLRNKQYGKAGIEVFNKYQIKRNKLVLFLAVKDIQVKIKGVCITLEEISLQHNLPLERVHLEYVRGIDHLDKLLKIKVSALSKAEQMILLGGKNYTVTQISRKLGINSRDIVKRRKTCKGYELIYPYSYKLPNKNKLIYWQKEVKYLLQECRLYKYVAQITNYRKQLQDKRETEPFVYINHHKMYLTELVYYTGLDYTEIYYRYYTGKRGKELITRYTDSACDTKLSSNLTLNVSELSVKTGISAYILKERIDLNIRGKYLLNNKIKKNKMVRYRGHNYTIGQLSTQTGVPVELIKYRYLRGERGILLVKRGVYLKNEETTKY